MATKIGPKTVTQRDRSKNLVFCVDAACSRSYGGEPTTNIQTGGGGSGGGDFSSGSTSGWSWDAKTDGTFDIYTADTHSGSYCARLKNSTISSIALWRDVTLTNGVTYTFSLWAKNINCPTVPSFSSAGTAVSTVSGGSNWTGISGNWQRFHWTFTVTGSTGAFSPYIRTAYNSVQGYFLVDDVQIEQKSAPTPFTATSRTTTNAITNISGVGAQGTNWIQGSAADTYGQSLFKPTTRNVLATFDPKKGHIGGAYWDFDGSDEYIDLGSIAFGTKDISVATWFALDAFDDDYACIFNNRTSSSGNAGFEIRQRTSGTKIELQFDWGAGSNAVSTGALSTGVWYHIVAALDRSGYLRGYLNGVEFGTPLDVSSYSAISITNDNSAFIGVDGHLSNFWNGRAANCMIWEAALTAKEIKDIYIAQKGRFGK